MATPKAVASALVIISRAYPGRFEADDKTAMVWERLLSDVSDEMLVVAVVQHTTHSKYPPSIAELREAAFDLVVEDMPSGGDAWAQVVGCIRRLGSYRAKEAHAELGALIWRCVEALGGWNALCLSEDSMVDRAHFLKVYEQIVNRERVRATTLPEVVEARARLRAPIPSSTAALPEGEGGRSSRWGSIESAGDVLARMLSGGRGE